MNRAYSPASFFLSVVSLVVVVLAAMGISALRTEETVDGESMADIDVFAGISFVDESWDNGEESASVDVNSSFFQDLSKNAESSEPMSESISEVPSEEISLNSSEENESSFVESSEERSEVPSHESIEDKSEDESSNITEDASSDSSEDESSETDVSDFPENVTLLSGGGEPFVYFRQDSAEWENKPYGTDKIGSHGCGPVSMAMVISTITGKVIYPDEAAKWSVDHGYWAKGVGTAHALMTAMAKAYNVPVSAISQGNWNAVIDALEDGKYIITRVKSGVFAANNHFMVIRGITKDGKILVANSISYEDSTKEWSLSTLKEQVNLGFWVYG